jgi:hypothetical protein
VRRIVGGEQHVQPLPQFGIGTAFSVEKAFTGLNIGQIQGGDD